MARKNMLGKLAMPKKPMADMEADQDLAMEDLELQEEELDEGEEDMAEDMLEEEMPEELGMLEEIADEDLLAEIKKRGLSLEDSEEEPEEDMEDEDAEMMDLGE